MVNENNKSFNRESVTCVEIYTEKDSEIYEMVDGKVYFRYRQTDALPIESRDTEFEWKEYNMLKSDDVIIERGSDIIESSHIVIYLKGSRSLYYYFKSNSEAEKYFTLLNNYLGFNTLNNLLQ